MKTSLKERKRKYRVWDKNRKQMVTKGLQFEYTEEYGISSIYDANERIIEDRIVMEFIGRKDKKKKDVFEGDILLNTTNGNSHKYIVVYENCGFIGVSTDGDEYGLFKLNLYINDNNPIIEVIGNIYEHPHLLGYDITAKKPSKKEDTNDYYARRERGEVGDVFG